MKATRVGGAVPAKNERGGARAASKDKRLAAPQVDQSEALKRLGIEYSGLKGVATDGGRTVRLVDAPSIRVGRTDYRVDRRHPTSAMLAMTKAATGQATSAAAARLGFDHLVEAVRDLQDPMISWKSFELYEGIRDHLDLRTDRANRTSQWSEVLGEMPIDERVVRIDRGLRALAKAFKAGKLPGVEREDLIDLVGRTQAVAFNFDMDHNILHLPGANYVLNTKTGDVRAFDHGEWAKVRHSIGQPGPLEEYKVLSSDLVFGTFQEADDGADPAAFERALRETVGVADGKAQRSAASAPSWQAPMWADFQWALARPETAQHVFITTARGHFPRTIHNAMKSVLQAGGHVAQVPNEDHIFPVTAHGLPQSQDYSKEKVRFIRKSLDQIQRQPFGPAAGLVRTANGSGSALMHTMVFSDDDLRTANLVCEALHTDQKAGRWPDVKVLVRFTGLDHPEEAPWARVVGGPNGPRAADEVELKEHVGLRARSDRARARMAQSLETSPLSST